MAESLEGFEGRTTQTKDAETTSQNRHSDMPFSAAAEATQPGQPPARSHQPLEDQSKNGAPASESKMSLSASLEPPTNVYQTQQFQHQNVMLNRDPEFLYKQHQLQQQLIQQHHKKMKDRQQRESSEIAEGQALNANASPLLQKESAHRLLDVAHASESRSTKHDDRQKDRPGHPMRDRKAERLETKQQLERDKGKVSVVVKKGNEASTGGVKDEQKEAREEKPEATKTQEKEQVRESYYIFPSAPGPFDLVRSALSYVTSESQAATGPAKERDMPDKKERLQPEKEKGATTNVNAKEQASGINNEKATECLEIDCK